MSWIPFAAMAASQIADKIFGGKDKMSKVPAMTKEQESLLNQIIKMLGKDGMGQGYGEAIGLQRQLMDPSSEAVQQFTDPYMKQFQQEIIPGIAERFAGMSPMGGGLMTSGFGQALGGAGAGLQSQLAALKAGLGQQAAGQLMSQYGGMVGLGLGAQPFAYQQQAPTMLGGLLSAWGKAGFPGPWSQQTPIALPGSGG